MPSIDKVALAAIQPELLPEEKVLWAGWPSTKIIFRGDDGGLTAFGFLWGGFVSAIAIGVMVAAVKGLAKLVLPGDLLRILAVTPFLLMGQYLIWGRFVREARKKKQTYYAVTNRRVVAVQHYPKRRVAAASVDALPVLILERRDGGFGTLRFTPRPHSRDFHNWDALWIGDGPNFVDIEDVDSVYQLLPGPYTRKSEGEMEARVAALLEDRKSRSR